MSTPPDLPAVDARHDQSQKSDVRLVSRISTVLRVLSNHPEGLSLGGISKESAIPRGTVQRLIDALEVEGLVARGEANASIRLGQEVARLGLTMNSGMRQFFRTIIEELRDQSGETIDLTILHPRGASVVDQVSSPKDLRVVSKPGQLLPIHATASGKASLALLEPTRRASVLGADLPALTGTTMTDPAALLAQIAATPRGDVFYDREEYCEGICAVAIDLGVSGFGAISIAISMPAARFPEAEERCRQLLIDLRRRLDRNPT